VVDLVLGELGALVVGACTFGQEVGGWRRGRMGGGLVDGAAVDARVQAKASIEESRRFCRAMTTSMPAARWPRGSGRGGPRGARGSAGGAGEAELGGVVGEAVDDLGDDAALGEVAGGELAQVALEAADHDLVEQALVGRDAAAEAVGVEDLEQGGEGVGVAVVRGGGEEEAVLEARAMLADGAGEVRVDGVAGARGGGGVVGLVEDEQGLRGEVSSSSPFVGSRSQSRSGAA
jgi:hypothetical protein